MDSERIKELIQLGWTQEQIEAKQKREFEEAQQELKRKVRMEILLRAEEILTRPVGVYGSRRVVTPPELEHLKSAAEAMKPAKLEEEIKGLEAWLELHRGFKKEVEAKAEQWAKDRFDPTVAENVRIGKAPFEVLERYKQHRTEFFEDKREEIEAVEKAIPYLEENLSVFKEGLTRKLAEKPTEQEFSKIKKRMAELAKNAKKITEQFDKLIPRFTQTPDNETLINKALLFLEGLQAIKNEYVPLEGQLRKWDIQPETSLPEPAHVPQSIRRIMNF